MKRILKIVVACVFIAIMFCCSSCNVTNSRTGFYNSRMLESNSLENLPVPDFKYKGDDSVYRKIYGTITENSFNEYVNILFEYLNNKFEYLGAEGIVLDDNMWTPQTRYVPCEKKLENYRIQTSSETTQSDTYCFVYFTKDPSSENINYETSTYVKVTFYYKELTYKQKVNDEYKDKFTYNFTIALRKLGISVSYVYAEGRIAKNYAQKNPECSNVTLRNLYCTKDKYNDVIMAVIIDCQSNTVQQPWQEKVGEYTFYYPDSNGIVIVKDLYYFYDVATVYSNGIIDDELLSEIYKWHVAEYGDLYIDQKEEI